MATLLIVEDDFKTNEAICEYLKPAGHTVVPAYDGEEALQLFKENSIDLVVLDIMLPRVSGLSVLHETSDGSRRKKRWPPPKTRSLLSAGGSLAPAP